MEPTNNPPDRQPPQVDRPVGPPFHAILARLDPNEVIRDCLLCFFGLKVLSAMSGAGGSLGVSKTSLNVTLNPQQQLAVNGGKLA